MRVLLSWLRDFAPLEGTPDELGDTMSDLGMAVEELRTFDLGGVVVARVLQTRPHPEADRVQLVDVDAGDGEALQIACGAFNLGPGDLVPLATVGATLPGGMEIGRRKLRGEWSNGMLCSAAELGLGADSAGIMVLRDGPARGDGAAPGDELVAALGLADDAVYDLEINPNRPDAMSIAGVARDLAGRLGVPFSIAEPAVASTGRRVTEAASVQIVDPGLCGRFTARIVRGVDATPPTALSDRLRLALCGMRPISPVVDASNLVMLELGVPNHAYDLAVVPDGVLRVRRAAEGEALWTLDGVERHLRAGDGLIADRGDRPIGLAGVMGGADTEIGPTTVDVLVEAAWWDPPSISRTARAHHLRSEASARFERGVDPELAVTATARFAELLGVPSDDGVIDERGELPWPRRTRLRPSRVAALLGVGLGPEVIATTLEPIGFVLTPAMGSADEPGGAFEVEVPTWRHDTATEIDLIEEIARHHGYDRLGRRVPRSPQVGRLSAYQLDRRMLRRTMVALGLDEAMPLPLLAPDAHERAGLDGHAPVRLANPLTADESTLRTSLLPGLLTVVAHNAAHRTAGVGLFELGTVFRATDADAELPDECEHLAAVLAGRDARDATRAVRATLDEVALDDGYRLVAAEDLPGLHPTRSARVVASGRDVGAVGEVDPVVVERYGIVERCGWFELDLDALLSLDHGHRPYVETPTFPSADVDLAFVVADAVPADAVGQTLRTAGGAEVSTVELFDVYRGVGVTDGHRSLAFGLRLQAPDRTLTDDEIATVRRRCIDAVTAAHAATLRGT